MDLATSRLFNFCEDEGLFMTRAEYNQFICGFSKDMTPCETEDYLYSRERERWLNNEKLYRVEEEL